MSRDNRRLMLNPCTYYGLLMRKTFRDALLAAISRPNVSLKAIADGSNVSYEQLKKLKQGKSKTTNVEDAMRVANYLGMSLDEFLGDDTALIRSEIVDLYSQLTPQQREFLLASVKGVLADPNPGNQ